MNILVKFALLLGAILTAAQVFAAEPTPVQQEVAVAEAQLKAAQQKAAMEKELAKSKARAEWASKSFTEAWKIRGQACIDASQYGVGQVGRGICNADGYVGAAVAYPAAYVATAAFSGAEASKNYAVTAWDNEPKTEVAIRVGDKEVKASVPAPETK